MRAIETEEGYQAALKQLRDLLDLHPNGARDSTEGIEMLGLATELEAYEQRTIFITCPKCGMTSHNIHDVIERYCGNCHLYIEDITHGGETL